MSSVLFDAGEGYICTIVGDIANYGILTSNHGRILKIATLFGLIER